MKTSLSFFNIRGLQCKLQRTRRGIVTQIQRETMIQAEASRPRIYLLLALKMKEKYSKRFSAWQKQHSTSIQLLMRRI
jgi:hypothetical protein